MATAPYLFLEASHSVKRETRLRHDTLDESIFCRRETVMPTHKSQDLTLLLRRWSEGSDEALEQLASRVESELRRLARYYLRSEHKGHLLDSGALVNEAWLRLIGWHNDEWKNREHFFGMAAQMMRRVLVDEARKRKYAKRGGDTFRVSLSEVNQPVIWRAEELIALNEALERLSKLDQRKAQIVEMRYFGGLEQKDISGILQISTRQVQRELRLALSWLYRELKSIQGNVNEPSSMAED
jgi:RNA polymerase sigma-70 factor (ECF subfamily)